MATVTLKIFQQGNPPQELPLPAGVYSIGSDAENKIVLQDQLISWRHAILSHTNGELSIEDLGSSTGTYIDGKRVTGREVIQPQQKVQIGSFVLQRKGADGPAATSPPIDPEPSATPSQAKVGQIGKAQLPPSQPAPDVPVAGDVVQASDRIHAETRRKARIDETAIKVKKQIHAELLKRMDLKRLTVTQATEKDVQKRARHTVSQIISEVKEKLPPHLQPNRLAKEIIDEALGLGPLEDLLADDSLTEVMVNGPYQIFIERAGKLILTETQFTDDAAVMAAIERIVSPIGRRIDESQPYVDARLADGSRVNAIISPLSLSGPCITIRKFSKDPYTVEDLIGFGSITRDMANFISCCVQARKNIIVSGGTGTGKTTMLNVVSNFLPASERIVTIEDAAELRLAQEHVIRLESRPPNMEGKGQIAIRDLVRNALRMRPDRIVVGECRGGEALDMLQAMNTGHDGSLTTIHANSPRDVISRLETMVLMSGMDLPVRAIREQVGAAIQLIVHLNRFSDGSRRVSRVTEVCGMEGDKITMQDLFEFKQTGLDENNKIVGYMAPTGVVPTFLEEMKAMGIPLDTSIFEDQGATWT